MSDMDHLSDWMWRQIQKQLYNDPPEPTTFAGFGRICMVGDPSPVGDFTEESEMEHIKAALKQYGIAIKEIVGALDKGEDDKVALDQALKEVQNGILEARKALGIPIEP